MKLINLITYRNNLISKKLTESGYSTLNYTFPLSESDFSELFRDSSAGYILLEVNMDNQNKMADFIDRVYEEKCSDERILCIVNEITEDMRCMFLSRGISDVLLTNDINRIVSYIKILNGKEESGHGKIVILESNNSIKKILKHIISQFGYEPIFVNSTESLSGVVSGTNIQFILVNIGIEILDIKKLIRKCFSNEEIKKVPVISYKDMNRGVFVHEIVTGLNRITKVILSIHELYSFLLDILFRKKIIPAIDFLNNSVKYDEQSFYSDKTLSQIYHLDEGDIFSKNNIFYDDNIEGIMKIISLLKRSLVLVDGLKWLKIENGLSEINTCGVSV